MEEATRTQVKNNFGEYLLKAFRNPVIVTDRGKKTHVVMAFDSYMEMIAKLEALEADKKRPAQVLETPEQG